MLRALFPLLIVAAVAGCGGSDDPSITDGPSALRAVRSGMENGIDGLIAKAQPGVEF